MSKRYGRGTWALRNIDLSLAAGGVVGLVGPNGAGKSTLLKLCVGFERATAGTVKVMGHDPWLERQAVLSRLAYLPQAPVFYRDLNVSDHLKFVAHYRGRQFDRDWAARRLSDLHVPLTARVSALSGGQTSQLGLAIALGLHAEVMLLDEPLASLDPLARREFIDVLMDDLGRTGASAVLSSHIVSDIQRACNRLVVLGVGCVQLSGSVDEILTTHVTSRADPGNGSAAIATLPDGATLYQTPLGVRRVDGSSAASLDDVVLGYLVADRGQVA